MWEFVKKYCPIRKSCLWICRQFVETAEFVRVLTDFHRGKGCDRHVRR